MKLSIKGLAITSAVLWGGSILVVGILNIVVPGYGTAFLELCDSIYPGYDLESTVLSVIIGTGYGLIDGAICGGLFGWIYNLVSAN
ncbi:MAG: hypothetical protein ABEK50_09135 [bacterium]